MIGVSRGRRATALSRLRLGLLLMLACAAWVFPARAVAQSISITFAPRDRTDSISPAPVINIATTQISPDALPATITLEASLEPQFRSPFLVRSTSELQAQFNVDSLLPQHTRVFFRARVIDRKGTIIAEQVTTGGVPVRSWLRLVSPIRTTDVLFTETPTFIWSSPAITLPPGPWTFTLRIINRAQNSTTEFSFSDTTGVPRVPLNACTSYRWKFSPAPSTAGRTIKSSLPVRAHSSSKHRTAHSRRFSIRISQTRLVAVKSWPRPASGLILRRRRR